MNIRPRLRGYSVLSPKPKSAMATAIVATLVAPLHAVINYQRNYKKVPDVLMHTSFFMVILLTNERAMKISF